MKIIKNYNKTYVLAKTKKYQMEKADFIAVIQNCSNLHKIL